MLPDCKVAANVVRGSRGAPRNDNGLKRRAGSGEHTVKIARAQGPASLTAGLVVLCLRSGTSPMSTEVKIKDVREPLAESASKSRTRQRSRNARRH
jgi:hypothetical protein